MKPQRTIREIASEIHKYWEDPYFGAVPYLQAMRQLNSINESFGFADSARTIILYFLSNAKTWRGEHARRIKAELKALCK